MLLLYYCQFLYQQSGKFGAFICSLSNYNSHRLIKFTNNKNENEEDNEKKNGFI